MRKRRRGNMGGGEGGEEGKNEVRENDWGEGG